MHNPKAKIAKHKNNIIYVLVMIVLVSCAIITKASDAFASSLPYQFTLTVTNYSNQLLCLNFLAHENLNYKAESEPKIPPYDKSFCLNNTDGNNKTSIKFFSDDPFGLTGVFTFTPQGSYENPPVSLLFKESNVTIAQCDDPNFDCHLSHLGQLYFLDIK